MEDEITKSIEKRISELSEKAKTVTSYVVERAPQIARATVMILTSSITTFIIVSSIIVAFPSIAAIAPIFVTMLSIVAQISIAMLILSLVIGLARTLR
ncbi:MAG: hypothetical protein QXW20_08405 [Ignisphaera sp.]